MNVEAEQAVVLAGESPNKGLQWTLEWFEVLLPQIPAHSSATEPGCYETNQVLRVAMILISVLAGCAAEPAEVATTEQVNTVEEPDFCRVWKGEKLGPNEKLRLLTTELAVRDINQEDPNAQPRSGAQYIVVPIYNDGFARCDY